MVRCPIFPQRNRSSEAWMCSGLVSVNASPGHFGNLFDADGRCTHLVDKLDPLDRQGHVPMQRRTEGCPSAVVAPVDVGLVDTS